MGKSKATSLKVQEKINIKSFALPWCYKNKLILRHRLRTLADMIDWEDNNNNNNNNNNIKNKDSITISSTLY